MAGNPEQNGRDGEPGFAGGYLNLNVAQDWIVKSPDGGVTFSSKELEAKSDQNLQLSLQYWGGRGGNGQKGGRGPNGTKGNDGADDKCEKDDSTWHHPIPHSYHVVPGRRAAPGSGGGTGKRGGNAGRPSTIGQSQIIAAATKLPAGKITFTLDTQNGQHPFRKPAVAGSGGDPGKGGAGGFEGVRLRVWEMSPIWLDNKNMCVTDQDAQKQVARAPDGQRGSNGDGPPAQDALPPPSVILKPTG